MPAWIQELDKCRVRMHTAYSLLLLFTLRSSLNSASCTNVCLDVVSASGWRETALPADLESAFDTIEIIDASTLPLSTLARRMASADAPLLLRGLAPAKRSWRKAFATLSHRDSFLREFGEAVNVNVSLSRFLAVGPERVDARLDGEKLAFMRAEWLPGMYRRNAANGSSPLAARLVAQIEAGNPRPQVSLGSFIRALLPHSLAEAVDGGEANAVSAHARASLTDGYVFHNVSGCALLKPYLAPLRKLWRKTTNGESPLLRLGVGGRGSGAPYHDHGLALNWVLAGRKRWLIARPSTPLAEQLTTNPLGPADTLTNVLNQKWFRSFWDKFERRGLAFSVVQHPGDVVLVPSGFVHSAVNLDAEVVAVAIQD